MMEYSYPRPFTQAAPLTPAQEAIVLGRGDHAPEPSTPEEWSLLGCESMYAIARLMQAKHGQIPKGTGYRPLSPDLIGVNVLYFDSEGQDEYEVRVQPNQQTMLVHDTIEFEERERQWTSEARVGRSVSMPEYRWSGQRPGVVTVQLNRQELPLDALSDNPEERLRLAEGHARYLRAVAIYAATDMNNQEILAELTPPEAHE